VRGVLHSFTGTWDDAQALLELGLHISFAGMVTFRNKTLDALRAVAARIPADRLLVETDSPYLSPHPHRGRTNEPGRVALTAARLAQVRGVSPAELARSTSANARRLFVPPAGGSSSAAGPSRPTIPDRPQGRHICTSATIDFFNPTEYAGRASPIIEGPGRHPRPGAGPARGRDSGSRPASGIGFA
jgi:hypothetical protein